MNTAYIVLGLGIILGASGIPPSALLAGVCFIISGVLLIIPGLH